MIEIKPENDGLIEVAFSLPWPEFEPFVEQAGKKLGQELEVDGFRKGQAPLKIVEQKIGWEKIYREAAFLALEKSWPEIAKEIKTATVGRPTVELTKLAAGNELEVKIKIIKKPEVHLPDHRSIAKKLFAKQPKDFSVSEQEINSAIEWLRRSRASYVAVSRPAQSGDYLEIDFSSKVADQPLEDGSSTNHPFILGQGRFMPGFDQKLAGLRSGETKDFSLQAPSDYYRQELAGKTVDFSVKVGAVQEVILPAFDDEFAQRIGKFKTAAELKNSIEQGLVEEKSQRQQREFEDELVAELVRQTNLVLPELLIEEETNSLTADILEQLEQSKVNLEDYLKRTNQTPEQLRTSVKRQAEQNLRTAFVLQEIARLEELKVEPEELDRAVEQRLEKYGSAKEAKKQKVDLAQMRLYTESALLNKKVIKFLMIAAENHAEVSN